ncbi:MAG: class I SAM-dependent DNA methyltransferase [Sphingobacteriales bacterium]|nr:MAG: class I SAM-dependent DNA methyltransferase [Sphingobacteriales bacterium]
MKIIELKPRKALNKAFLKVKPNRTEIEGFKTNLIALLDRINDTESEEFHKNLVIDFLKKTYYEPNHYINTKGRNDLVIHNGNTFKSSVGVIIEAKKPTNKSEMLTTKKLNVKAFQELVLYYLRERITHKNIEVKHLVATNINEWFIFDATLFERLFAQNKNLVKQFTEFEDGRLADTKTDFFYKQIAEPFINQILAPHPSGWVGGGLEFTYFNIQDYQKPLRNTNKADDNSLIALFKLLSPQHLLKLPFTNDSNSLDKRFYSELLHIIGLTETKEGNKKLIERNKTGERHSGTILEDAIIQLDSLDKLSRLNKPNQFGSTQQERLFNVALELSITWINRILFLKLLEAQLITYHKGNKSYSFLNLQKIKNYDDLNNLFFQVLARKYSNRNDDVKKAFEKVPYLNSSLFEPTEIEQVTFFISNLNDDKKIPIISTTVLKNNQGKKRTGSLNTLEYMFEFLNAYDFSSEGSEEIQEDNKTLINASVLGLIFEKINGYKDGSFFTPGFITMYMCRETIRKAVVQKFNDYCLKYDLMINKIEDIYELIPLKISRKKANEIVNSLKICDPAVGSGHFLVSALNEMIAIKNDLKILEDKEGKSLHRYEIEVVNDELIVTDEEGELFEYNPSNKESQRIQETLFHEKQTIIENCLFGVDINTNSVKICRLRLWIELLKNAYYKTDITHGLNRELWELETLPNIDINIKCGNSLVSRFAIDADLAHGLNSGLKSKWNIDTYKIAVSTYRNAESKEQKREMERLIADIKSDFRSEISLNDPKVKKLRKLSGELFQMTHQTQLFEMSKKEKADWNKKVTQLSDEIKKLEIEIEDIKANKIFENAFEWRFEFPEVLNDDGDFVGFDVVIGNPPYFTISNLEKQFLNYFESINLKTFIKSTDIYCVFIELAKKIGSKLGRNHFIVSNKWLTANYGEKTRTFLSEHTSNIFIIDFNKHQIFEEALVDACLLSFSNQNGKRTDYLEFDVKEKSENITDFLNEIQSSTKIINLNDTWNLGGFQYESIREKIEKNGRVLNTWDVKFYRGITTGFNDAFVIDLETKNRLINENKKNAEIIKPLLRGRDIKKYGFEKRLLWLINTHNGLKSEKLNPVNVPETFPSIYNYLNNFKEKLLNRIDKGNDWFNLRNCTYLKEFEKEKLVFTKASKIQAFAYDNKGHFVLNTSYILVGEKLKYLLGILNSKFFQFAFIKFYQSGGIDGEITVQAIEKVPIFYPNPKEENLMIKLVDKIIELKEKNKNTTALETQINQLVYQLYNLTEEEIKIVEGNG